MIFINAAVQYKLFWGTKISLHITKRIMQLFKFESKLVTVLAGLVLLAATVQATPPACFLSCINEISRTCLGGHTDLACLCASHQQVIECLVDICPYGPFEASRDHFYGTCLEHDQPTYGNYPPGYDPDCDHETKTTTDLYPTSSPGKKTITKTISTTTEPSYPTETDVDCGSDDEGEGDEGEDEAEYDFCEWQEEETTDSNGWVTITRKPINVPEKYLKPPYTDTKKRTLIILRPKANEVDEAQVLYKTTSDSRLAALRKPHYALKNHIS